MRPAIPGSDVVIDHSDPPHRFAYGGKGLVQARGLDQIDAIRRGGHGLK
jgi:hypothetical protein